jgi:hypothetical protein
LNLQRISNTSSKKPRKTAARSERMLARLAVRLLRGKGGRMGSGMGASRGLLLLLAGEKAVDPGRKASGSRCV